MGICKRWNKRIFIKKSITRRKIRILFDFFNLSVYNKYRKWKTTNVVADEYVKNTSNRQVTDVFFIVYLLKIITSIIKANTIIVSTTKPNKSKYIISNKTASIIAPPPFSRQSRGLKVATTSAIFISYAS